MAALRDHASLPPIDSSRRAAHRVPVQKRASSRHLSLDLYDLQCEILEMIARGSDFAAAAELLCHRVDYLAPGAICSILLIEDGRLHPLAAPGVPEDFVAAIRGMPVGPEIGSCGSCAFHGTEVDVPDIAADPRWEHYRDVPLAAGLRACWSTPIVTRDGRVIGTFALYFRTARSPSRRERRLVSSCIYLCALLIERQSTLGALSRASRVLDTTLETMSQGVCLFDADETLKVVNRRFLQIFGLSSRDLHPGMTLDEVVAQIRPHCRDELSADALIGAWRGVYAAGRNRNFVDRLRDGRVISLSALAGGEGSWLCTVEDITEHRRAEARISYMALHDTLTGLPNRTLLLDMLDTVIAQATPAAPCVLLTIDLDRFRAINDAMGHHMGDALLSCVAARLLACVELRGMVSRLGGDEFAIVLSHAPEVQTASEIAAAVLREIAQPYTIDGTVIEISASVGIAFAPADAATSEQLLRHSALARSRAKRDRPDTYRFYEPAMSRVLDERRSLELDLRGALHRDEFQLFFQPVFSLKAGRISGFEALLRWNHPQRGMIMPAVFIPIAEEAKLIAEIGAWVIRKACTAAAVWPDDIKVSVNLSAAQFGDDLVGLVRDALAASGLAATRLDLEITESVLLDDNLETLSILRGLCDMGVQVSMDDFGTGYSSLSYLNRFPFSRIKIDRSFVSDLPAGRSSLAIVRAVVGLGKTLSMITTAEGVETEDQLDILRAEGCDEVQGYLFSHPSPLTRVDDILAASAHRFAS